MSSDAGSSDAIIPSLVALRVTECTFVACGALFAYDCFLTFEREVYCVWNSRWTLGKILYLLNRYSPIVDTVMLVYSFTSVTDPNVCPLLTRAALWALLAGTFISEIILAMRTYALWDRRLSMLVFLVSFTVTIFSLAVVIVKRLLDGTTFVQVHPLLKSPRVGINCIPLAPAGHIAFVFLVSVVNQTVIAALTLYCRLQYYRLCRGPMITTMFHDGLLYYIYILVISMANVVVAVAAPVQYGLLLALPFRVMFSICCTRVVLGIRGAYVSLNESSLDGIPSRSFGLVSLR